MADTKTQTYALNEIEIFDTTLRDGSQSSDVNFSIYDKIELVKALDDFGIDYIELGWPGSNPKDIQSFKEVQNLTLRNSKIVAFGSTKRIGITAKDDSNLNAIIESNANIACIFGKTWIEHITKQLNTNPVQNLKSISESIAFLTEHNLRVIYDLEHFFEGFKGDKDYALKCIEIAYESGADTLVMCDTNGGTLPSEIREIILQVNEFLKRKRLSLRLGIHTHNDSGFGVANAIEAVNLGIHHVQGTINGLGERTGNADLCQIIPILKLKMGLRLDKIELNKLTKISRLAYTLANIKPYDRQPFVGKSAFAHKGGVHVDAVMKGASYEHITPELVGNRRDIVLSDLSGRATIVEIAKRFGYDVKKDEPKVAEMLKKVELMERQGYDIGTLKAEHYLLVEEFLGKNKSPFTIDSWEIVSKHEESEDSTCNLKGKINSKIIKETATAKGGPVDAAYKSLQKLIAKYYTNIYTIKLVNYKVMIAEEKGAESTVRVYIEFKNGNEEWATVGVNQNILTASIEAVEKGFRYYLKQESL